MASGKTILVVDDEMHIRCVIGRKLENAGYRVLLSGSVEEAKQLVEAEVPALVVTDLRMPGGDGLEFSRWLREREATSKVPIIMVTGSLAVTEELRPDVERLGTQMVSKPFSLRKLLQMIEEVLSEE